MDLTEAMTTQRAIRRLKPDPVDDETRRPVGEITHLDRYGNRAFAK